MTKQITDRRMEQVYQEDFERCVTFIMGEMHFYRLGKVGKATMKTNVDEAWRIYRGITDKSRVSITFGELNSIVDELRSAA